MAGMNPKKELWKRIEVEEDDEEVGFAAADDAWGTPYHSISGAFLESARIGFNRNRNHTESTSLSDHRLPGDPNRAPPKGNVESPRSNNTFTATNSSDQLGAELGFAAANDAWGTPYDSISGALLESARIAFSNRNHTDSIALSDHLLPGDPNRAPPNGDVESSRIAVSNKSLTDSIALSDHLLLGDPNRAPPKGDVESSRIAVSNKSFTDSIALSDHLLPGDPNRAPPKGDVESSRIAVSNKSFTATSSSDHLLADPHRTGEELGSAGKMRFFDDDAPNSKVDGSSPCASKVDGSSARASKVDGSSAPASKVAGSSSRASKVADPYVDPFCFDAVRYALADIKANDDAKYTYTYQEYINYVASLPPLTPEERRKMEEDNSDIEIICEPPDSDSDTDSDMEIVFDPPDTDSDSD